ncbi:12052_t:CDS:1, partial [Racocetra persica]
ISNVISKWSVDFLKSHHNHNSIFKHDFTSINNEINVRILHYQNNELQDVEIVLILNNEIPKFL